MFDFFYFFLNFYFIILIHLFIYYLVMADLFKEEPIQLVSYNEDGFFEITNEGFDWLNSIINLENIQILSIIGPKKSGKSFILNSLMKNNKGFKYEELKGIYAWGKPIELNNGNKLILIDSEGIEDFENNNNKNIVNLLKCISNLIIYHIKGEINNDIIENFTKIISIKDNIIISDNEINTLPNIIFSLGNYINSEKKARDYVEEFLNKDEKIDDIIKYYPNIQYYYIPLPILDEERIKDLEKEDISSLNPEYMKVIEEIYKENKNIKNKLNGNSLFYIIQNFIESCNNKEIYDVSQGLNNIYGVKARKILEEVLEDFKNEIEKKTENNYPLNFDDIYKMFYELLDKETSNFCNKVEKLNPKYCGEFLNKLYKRMWGEIESIYKKNVSYFNVWLNNIYLEFEKNLNSISFEKNEQIKNYFSTYLNNYKNISNKFLEMPNNDFEKNLIQIYNNLNQNLIIDKFIKVSEKIEENLDNTFQKNISEMNNLKISMDKLNEELETTKKFLEEKRKEKNEINHSYLELENKFDKISRESTIKEKEYLNNLEIENQRFQKMEKYYLSEIKEKENKIIKSEFEIEKLNKETNELKKELSKVKNELNREIIKLNVEIETLRNNNTKSKIDLLDISKPNLQTILKGVQNTFNDFKDRIEKIDKNNNEICDNKFYEYSIKEIENKVKNWIEEIKNYKNEELKLINENYEKEMIKTKEKIEELSFEITKKNYIIDEQNEMKNQFEVKINESKNQFNHLNEMINSKEDLIKNKDETLKAYEDKMNNNKNTIGDLEMKLNESIVEFKIKKDEVESIITLIDDILSKKKDKIKKSIDRISTLEYKEYLTYLLKKNGLIK